MVKTGDFGVGGHNGLLGSNIGADISLLSMEGAREEREECEDECLRPLSESVSLRNEKERSERVLEAGVSFPGDGGGVTSPIGMRWSPSLTDRLSFTMAARSSMVARVEVLACWG